MTKLRDMQEGGSASAVTQEHFWKNKELYLTKGAKHTWADIEKSVKIKSCTGKSRRNRI